MTRFREEVYASRWYKTLIRREIRAESLAEADKRESGSLHFQKPLSVRKAINKAQKASRRLM